MGLSITDARQVKLYGRYLAIALALKAEVVDGKPQPKYNTQQIYNQLKEYGVSELDSKDIVWRIMRGTSLKHQGVMLNVSNKGETFKLPAAECFVKDALYFEGQQEIFNWMKEKMPIKAGHRSAVAAKTPEFSSKTLARVGLKKREMEEGKALKLSYSQAKNAYPGFVEEGREALFAINNLLSAGKMRLDFLKEGSFWEKYLQFGSKNGQIDLQHILSSR